MHVVYVFVFLYLNEVKKKNNKINEINAHATPMAMAIVRIIRKETSFIGL